MVRAASERAGRPDGRTAACMRACSVWAAYVAHRRAARASWSVARARVLVFFALRKTLLLWFSAPEEPRYLGPK